MHVIYQQTRSNFTRLSGYKKDIVIHSFSQVRLVYGTIGQVHFTLKSKKKSNKTTQDKMKWVEAPCPKEVGQLSTAGLC